MSDRDFPFTGELEADAPYPLTIERLAKEHRISMLIHKLSDEGLDKAFEALTECVKSYPMRTEDDGA